MFMHVKQWVQQPIFVKPGDWVLYWNKPKSLLTLPSGCNGPFTIVGKVSPVDYTIQFAPNGQKKTVHCDELQMDPCNQDKPKWIYDELAPQNQNAVNSDRVVLEQNLPRLPTTTDILPSKGPLP